MGRACVVEREEALTLRPEKMQTAVAGAGLDKICVTRKRRVDRNA